MSNEVLNLLFEATGVLTLALVAVLLLRGGWLRAFGARNTLLLWLIAPIALVALLLPAPVERIDLAAGDAATASESAQALLPAIRERVIEMSPSGVPAPGGVWQAAAPIDMAVLILGVWLVGAGLLAGRMSVNQVRLVRSLGPLTRMSNGCFRSSVSDIGPAVVGAIRPRIVLPADFEQRFSVEQQALIIAHERCHLRRGDAQFNLLACVLRCLFWFNPVVHLAWPRLRMDQELACDAAVLRTRRRQRRAYAEALLAARSNAPALPLGCPWLSGKPLTRRIQLTFTHPIGSIRLLCGTALVLLTASVAALGAWNQQEPRRFYLPDSVLGLELHVTAAEPDAWGTGRERPVVLRTVPLPAPEVALRPPETLASTAGPATARVDELAANSAESSEGRAVVEPLDPQMHVDAAPSSIDRAAERRSGGDLVEVEHARLIEVDRPHFPDAKSQPRLVSYPGMPEAERPGADWQPEGRLRVLLLRVSLDEAGRPIGTSVEDSNFEDERTVARYRRLAAKAVRGWRYEPARIDGSTVRSDVLLPFYFDSGPSFRHIDYTRVGPEPWRPSTLARTSRLTNR